MQLALQTDSVRAMPFEQVLDLCGELGVTNLEIPTGGQSSAPHLKIDELLGDPASLARFQDQLASRGLTIAALNCSAWPLHPVFGPAHVESHPEDHRTGWSARRPQDRDDVRLPGGRARGHDAQLDLVDLAR